MQVCRWHHLPDSSMLQRAVVAQIVSCAETSIQLRGVFQIVLAGGQTPQAIYTQLRAITTDWRAWHIYFGDERCLPSGDPQRNDTMARAAWLDHVPIPAAQIHSIPVQQGAAIGAQQYAALLAGVGDFDLVLLGLGEDGHTASLFPGDRGALEATCAALAISNAPKPPAQRVSLSAARLSRARCVLFLVIGSDKLSALTRWRRGEDIPARFIEPVDGVDIYTDSIFS